jgi:hypothetical protein
MQLRACCLFVVVNGCEREAARSQPPPPQGAATETATRVAPAPDPIASYAAPQPPPPAWLLGPWTTDAHVVLEPSHLTQVPATVGQRIRLPTEAGSWGCVMQPVNPEPIVGAGRRPLRGEQPERWYMHRNVVCSSDGWRHSVEAMLTIGIEAATRKPTWRVEQQELYLNEGEKHVAVVLKSPWSE